MNIKTNERVFIKYNFIDERILPGTVLKVLRFKDTVPYTVHRDQRI